MSDHDQKHEGRIPKNGSDHRTIHDTRQSGYDDLRRSGVDRDTARRVSSEAADSVHRHADKGK